MADDPLDAAKVVMQRLKLMEAKLRGMKKMRLHMDEPGRKVLDRLIKESESQLAEIKRKVLQ